MNPYRLLADLIAAVHLGWVGFVVIAMGLILVGIWRRWAWVRNFWFRVAHFLMIGIVVAESLGGIVCPLTGWEYQLRIKAGGTGQPGSFVGRLVHAMLFVEAPEWVFTVCYCLFGLAVLITLIMAPPQWPRWRSKGT